MTQKKSFKVLILGGGIAGPSLALFLNQRGIEAHVFELHDYKEGIGGGFNISPNGIKVLQEIAGLVKELQSKGTLSKTAYFRDDSGYIMAELKTEDVEKYKEISISMKRSVLFEALKDKIDEKKIPISFNKKVTKIVENVDGVVLEFDDGTKEEGDILIGADGAQSIVRQYMLPEGPNPEYVGIIGIGGFVDKNEINFDQDEEAIHFVFGPRGFFGYGGFGNGEIGWWANLAQEKEFSKEEIRNFKWKDVQQSLLDRFKDYEGMPIKDLITKTKDVTRQNVYDLLSLPYWHKNRICLIGDAAHTISPNSGQGVSLAVEDSLLLARLLEHHKCDYEPAFKQFQDLRKDRVEMIVLDGRKRSAGKEEVHWIYSKIRNFFLKLILNYFGTSQNEIVWAYDVPNKF